MIGDVAEDEEKNVELRRRLSKNMHKNLELLPTVSSRFG